MNLRWEGFTSLTEFSFLFLTPFIIKTGNKKKEKIIILEIQKKILLGTTPSNEEVSQRGRFQ